MDTKCIETIRLFAVICGFVERNFATWEEKKKRSKNKKRILVYIITCRLTECLRFGRSYIDLIFSTLLWTKWKENKNMERNLVWTFFLSSYYAIMFHFCWTILWLHNSCLVMFVRAISVSSSISIFFFVVARNFKWSEIKITFRKYLFALHFFLFHPFIVHIVSSIPSLSFPFVYPINY